MSDDQPKRPVDKVSESQKAHDKPPAGTQVMTKHQQALHQRREALDKAGVLRLTKDGQQPCEMYDSKDANVKVVDQRPITLDKDGLPKSKEHNQSEGQVAESSVQSLLSNAAKNQAENHSAQKSPEGKQDKLSDGQQVLKESPLTKWEAGGNYTPQVVKWNFQPGSSEQQANRDQKDSMPKVQEASFKLHTADAAPKTQVEQNKGQTNLDQNRNQHSLDSRTHTRLEPHKNQAQVEQRHPQLPDQTHNQNQDKIHLQARAEVKSDPVGEYYRDQMQDRLNFFPNLGAMVSAAGNGAAQFMQEHFMNQDWMKQMGSALHTAEITSAWNRTPNMQALNKWEAEHKDQAKDLGLAMHGDVGAAARLAKWAFENPQAAKELVNDVAAVTKDVGKVATGSFNEITQAPEFFHQAGAALKAVGTGLDSVGQAIAKTPHGQELNKFLDDHPQQKRYLEGALKGDPIAEANLAKWAVEHPRDAKQLVKDVALVSQDVAKATTDAAVNPLVQQFKQSDYCQGILMDMHMAQAAVRSTDEELKALGNTKEAKELGQWQKDHPVQARQLELAEHGNPQALASLAKWAAENPQEAKKLGDDVAAFGKMVAREGHDKLNALKHSMQEDIKDCTNSLGQAFGNSDFAKQAGAAFHTVETAFNKTPNMQELARWEKEHPDQKQDLQGALKGDPEAAYRLTYWALKHPQEAKKFADDVMAVAKDVAKVGTAGIAAAGGSISEQFANNDFCKMVGSGIANVDSALMKTPHGREFTKWIEDHKEQAAEFKLAASGDPKAAAELAKWALANPAEAAKLVGDVKNMGTDLASAAEKGREAFIHSIDGTLKDPQFYKNALQVMTTVLVDAPIEAGTNAVLGLNKLAKWMVDHPKLLEHMQQASQGNPYAIQELQKWFKANPEEGKELIQNLGAAGKGLIPLIPGVGEGYVLGTSLDTAVKVAGGSEISTIMGTSKTNSPERQEALKLLREKCGDAMLGIYMTSLKEAAKRGHKLAEQPKPADTTIGEKVPDQTKIGGKVPDQTKIGGKVQDHTKVQGVQDQTKVHGVEQQRAPTESTSPQPKPTEPVEGKSQATVHEQPGEPSGMQTKPAEGVDQTKAHGVEQHTPKTDNSTSPQPNPAELKPESKPVHLTPAESKPVKVEPAHLTPAESKPVKVEPAQLTPAELKPVKVEPAQLTPAELKPVKVEPVKVEPVAAKPADVAPAKPADATPAKPADAAPANPNAAPGKPGESTATKPADGTPSDGAPPVQPKPVDGNVEKAHAPSRVEEHAPTEEAPKKEQSPQSGAEHGPKEEQGKEEHGKEEHGAKKEQGKEEHAKEEHGAKKEHGKGEHGKEEHDEPKTPLGKLFHHTEKIIHHTDHGATAAAAAGAITPQAGGPDHSSAEAHRPGIQEHRE